MAETDPIIERILPDEVEPLDADEQFGILEDDLEVPEDDGDFIDDEDAARVTDEQPPPIGRSWDFDFGERRFRTVRGRGPLEVRGMEVLRKWVEKALNTQRSAHAIYSDDYGVEEPFHLIGQAGDVLDSAPMQEQITEALTFHPRISNVKDYVFDFDPEDEALWVTFTVVADDEDEIVLEELRLV